MVNKKGFENKIKRKVYRNIIAYANNIIITTNNSKEIKHILLNISNSLSKFDLNLSSTQTQIINYFNNKKTKFNYLGFTFYHVPIKHIKKGGILTSNENITKKKKEKIGIGIYLVYLRSTEFHNIKIKLKKIIKLLKRESMIDVLNKINFVIKSFSNYYSWSNGFHRLRTLNGLLFRYFKKHLISKFKKKGIKRPVWVAKNFLVCKSNNQNLKLKSKDSKNGKFFSKDIYTSPYGLRWHPHCKLFHNKENCLRFKKNVFLVMATKCTKVLPITNAILPSKLRNQPYYLIENKFVLNSAQLQK